MIAFLEKGIKSNGLYSLKNRISKHVSYPERDWQLLSMWLNAKEKVGSRLPKTIRKLYARMRGLYMQRNPLLPSKLTAIRDRLQEAGVDWAIFAGAAASYYGSKREITDIDILVRCECLEKAKSELKDIDTHGFDIECGSEIKTAQGSCSFFFDDEMVEKTNWKYLFGVRVPVISVEDNIVFKAILHRGEEEGKHDLEDIKAMVTHEKIDVEYLEKRIRRSKAEKRVNPLLRSLIASLGESRSRNE